MTETEFNSLAAQGYNRIPVTLETFADLDTPLSIYLKLTSGPNNGHYSYLLESVQGGERFGRYSIIGLAAQTRIVVHGHQVLVLTGNRVAERENDTNPEYAYTDLPVGKNKLDDLVGGPHLSKSAGTSATATAVLDKETSTGDDSAVIDHDTEADKA